VPEGAVAAVAVHHIRETAVLEGVVAAVVVHQRIPETAVLVVVAQRAAPRKDFRMQEELRVQERRQRDRLRPASVPEELRRRD